MKTFAVSYFSFLNNQLKTKIVRATTWKDALAKTFKGSESCADLTDDMEIAKEAAFNQDWMFDVVEVPKEVE